MKGHEHILTLRKQRLKPVIIFLNDYPCKTDWAETEDHATVCIHGDPVETLDLRFLEGCVVSVSTDNENRAKALLDACKKAKANKVLVVEVETDKTDNLQKGYVGLWQI